MAFCIDIKKVAETPELVEYTYAETDGRMGRFAINRKTGETHLIERANGDDREMLYVRAARKIWKAWEAGHLPDYAMWAS